MYLFIKEPVCDTDDSRQSTVDNRLTHFKTRAAKGLARVINETQSLLTKLGFNAALYAGHSYRIGAATTAASAKLPSWLIKTLGRWTSDCYERYIKIPPATLSGVSATLTDMLNAK